MSADVAGFVAAAEAGTLTDEQARRWMWLVTGGTDADLDDRVDDVVGAQLHEGHVIVQALPDGTVERHTVDHFAEYPQLRTRDGRLVDGYHDGHARIVYGTDGWRHSCADTEHFHVEHEGEQS